MTTLRDYIRIAIEASDLAPAGTINARGEALDRARDLAACYLDDWTPDLEDPVTLLEEWLEDEGHPADAVGYAAGKVGLEVFSRVVHG